MEKLHEQFDQWAVVELMGRQRIAGKVTERVIAGSGFLQVDVPETKSARLYAENLQVKPIDAWDINAFMRKVEQQRALMAGADASDDDDDNDND